MMRSADESSSGVDSENYCYTYSLWGNSRYYDIKNLSPQNYFSKSATTVSAEACEAPTSGFERWSGEEAAKERDVRNRRIIKRESLFEEPDLFYKNNEDQEPDWTDQYWKKEGDWEAPRPHKYICRQTRRDTPEQEKLNESLACPIKMSKAESIMQKMGWQGGALGKTGEGIVEPIVPNLIYSTKHGLGTYTEPTTSHKTDRTDKQTEKKQKLDNQQIFDTNTLLHIFEFVKNNSEVELLFDKKLTRAERKRVHFLVNDVLCAEDLALVDYSSVQVMDLALQICDHNCYVLETQSEGAHPDRTLCLYKLPPSHVYLIIPDDLRDDPNTKKGIEPQTDVEEDTNPFLQSITRNLKNCKTEEGNKCDENCKHDSEILNKLLEFFSEFAENTEFTVFRYLGPFNKDEWDGVNEFLDLANKYVNGGDICGKYSAVFKKVKFEINVDINGHTVIYKKMGSDEES